jgi:hypothetical protein
MADDDKFKLSKEQRDKIADSLTEKGARLACPACGTNQWLVGEHLLRADLFSSEGTFLGGPSYPLAFVVCQNCFFVRTHLAIALGVIEALKAEEAAEAEQADG